MVFESSPGKGRGKNSKSKTSSIPQPRANVMSKRSRVSIKDVQLPKTQVVGKQTKTHQVSDVDKWVKFIAWLAVMGVFLGYGMYQHDDGLLYGVMVLVTVGCGYGNAVEVLIKFLDAKGIHPRGY